MATSEERKTALRSIAELRRDRARAAAGTVSALGSALGAGLLFSPVAGASSNAVLCIFVSFVLLLGALAVFMAASLYQPRARDVDDIEAGVQGLVSTITRISMAASVLGALGLIALCAAAFLLWRDSAGLVPVQVHVTNQTSQDVTLTCPDSAMPISGEVRQRDLDGSESTFIRVVIRSDACLAHPRTAPRVLFLPREQVLAVSVERP